MKKYRPLLTIFGLVLLISLAVTAAPHYFARPATVNEVGLSTSPSCQTPRFSASTPLTVPNFTYPALVSGNNNTHLLFVGGLTSTLPAPLKNLPGRTRFPISQEEIWRLTSTDLKTWSAPTPSFALMPETPVSFKGNRPYSSVYPNGFKSGCSSLPNQQCNVQINDPTVIRFNSNLYLYFSILENYRWYDGTLGKIENNNPTNPAEQNRHSIGLAVSGDDGKNWAFVDKIIPENTKDDTGNPILGAWAPSALVTGTDTVELYFHDALGTKQYVATLKGGVSPTSITRLNPRDEIYRTNLDVIQHGNQKIMLYNDSNFSIVQTIFTRPEDFGLTCPPQTIVPGNSSTLWPTPHQYLHNNTLHLYFWQFGATQTIHHWVRSLQ